MHDELKLDETRYPRGPARLAAVTGTAGEERVTTSSFREFCTVDIAGRLASRAAWDSYSGTR